MRRYSVPASIVAVAATLWVVFAPPRTCIDPHKVLAKGRSITSRSWEFGALVEALLEFHDPELTVFGSNAFPSGLIPQVTEPWKVASLTYAKSIIWTNGSDLLIDGEGSAADPASLGTAALLLSYHDQTYLEAAKRQAEYLVNKAKKFRINATDSTISHRENIPELWGDSIYMAPPFLAYYGVATQDMRYLKVAVSQCRLYNEILSTSITLADGQSCHGLWRHIISIPAALDPGVCCSDQDVWLTSSVWAIAGMTRVLATVLKWRPPPNSIVRESEYNIFKSASKTMLTRLIASMLHCTVSQVRDEETGLLKNYLDGPLHRSSPWAYGDAAGTALMASAVYRLAVLLPEIYAVPSLLDWADQNSRAVATHIDQYGRVFPVADVGHVPSKWPVNETSEGQSMVVLMYSAWRDCADAGICSRDGGMWNKMLRSFRSW